MDGKGLELRGGTETFPSMFCFSLFHFLEFRGLLIMLSSLPFFPLSQNVKPTEKERRVPDRWQLTR